MYQRTAYQSNFFLNCWTKSHIYLVYYNRISCINYQNDLTLFSRPFNYQIYIISQNPIEWKSVEKRVLFTFFIECFDVRFFTSLPSNLCRGMLIYEENVWRRQKEKVVSFVPIWVFYAMKLAYITMEGPGIHFFSLYLNKAKMRAIHF